MKETLKRSSGRSCKKRPWHLSSRGCPCGAVVDFSYVLLLEERREMSHPVLLYLYIRETYIILLFVPLSSPFAESSLMINCSQLQGRSPLRPESFLCRHFCACRDGYVVVVQYCRHARMTPGSPRGHKSASLVSLVSSSWPPTLPFCGVRTQLSKRTCFLEMLCCAETDASQLRCVSPTQPSLSVLAERKPRPFFLPPCWLLTVEPYLNRKTCTFFRIPSPSPCLEVSSQPRGGCGGVGHHGTSLHRIPLPLHGAAACRSAPAGHPQRRTCPLIITSALTTPVLHLTFGTRLCGDSTSSHCFRRNTTHLRSVGSVAVI